MRAARRLLATAAGVCAGRVLPELPDRIHPVAHFGRTMTTIEQRVWRDDRRAGTGYAASGLVLGALAGRSARSTSLTVAVCAAGGQLRRTAGRVADRLEAGDVDGARATLPALVGRDPSELDEAGIAAAAIESVAENMVDAVFAPAFWGAVAGATGAAAYRAVNTMDAMVGRRDTRYERFGWASARLDDHANWIPARLFVATVVGAVPGRASVVRTTVRDDAPGHPSPNAGVAEAAMAAALGCELGGPLRYGEVVEDRPVLGAGPRPSTAELRQAIRIAQRTEELLVVALAGSAVLLADPLRFWRRRRP